MTHYIDKEALLAEIDKLKQNLSASPIVVIEDVISLVESLEVKEVDLEKEIKNAINEYYNECEKKLQKMNDNDTDMSFLQLDKFAKGITMKEVIEGWIARDNIHSCPFLFSEKPELDKEGWEYGSANMWRVKGSFSVGTEEGIVLPRDTFPELKRENSPRKVKITIEEI